MFSTVIFWPWFTGLIFLIGGLILAGKRVAQEPWLEKLVALGPVFYAASLAAFGAEHIVASQSIKNVVPNWMPAHLFWTYLVALALLCAAISIILMRYVSLSAALLGTMFFLFVLLLHVPNVVANPSNRILWAVALRDTAFGGAAWALAGSQGGPRAGGVRVTVGRITVGIAMIFYSIEHFLHPNALPGVPLPKLMPSCVPFGVFWGYLTGAALLVAGTALLLRKKDRVALTWTGLLIALLVLFIYVPLLPLATKPSEMNEATNYIFDTLLFAGAILVVARALPGERRR